MNTIEMQSGAPHRHISLLRETMPQSTQTPGRVNAEASVSSESIPAWLHLLSLLVSSQVTIGLAKVFDFEILTHGTSFRNCYGILKNGADPSKGGSEIGSTTFYANGNSNSSVMQNANNYFYVFKDSEAKKGLSSKTTRVIHHLNGPSTVISGFQDKNGKIFKEQQFEDLSFIDHLELYLSPRFHAALAGISHTDSIENKVKKIVEQIFYGVTNFLFSPTLRFIYTLDETKNIFESDPDYAGYAYRTSEKLPNSRIGLVGVCKHANIEGLKRGLQERPARVVAGAVQVLAGSILTCTGLGLFL
jgi:hypothetical protein